LFVALDSHIFAVNDQKAAEAERTAKGFGEKRVVRELVNLFPDLQEDLFAREIVLISEPSEGNAVNMGNPEDRTLTGVID
jgi:hypothetical protein